MTRYWFEFEIAGSRDARAMPWVGVTAWTLDDAKRLMSERLFGGRALPVIAKLIEDVNVEELDEHHVRRHMEPPSFRGVWYPVGYSEP